MLEENFSPNGIRLPGSPVRSALLCWISKCSFCLSHVKEAGLWERNTVHTSVCVSHFRLLNLLIDLHEIWFGRCNRRGYTNPATFNFVHFDARTFKVRGTRFPTQRTVDFFRLRKMSVIFINYLFWTVTLKSVSVYWLHQKCSIKATQCFSYRHGLIFAYSRITCD